MSGSLSPRQEFKAWFSRSDKWEVLRAQDSSQDSQYSTWMQGTIDHFKYFDKVGAGGCRWVPVGGHGHRGPRTTKGS